MTGKSHNNEADALFPLFKGAPFLPLPVIRARKWLVTCSWEPLEKNAPGINGAATGPGAEPGVGKLKVPSVGCSGEIALRRPLEPRAPSLGTRPLYSARMGGRPDNVVLYLV